MTFIIFSSNSSQLLNFTSSLTLHHGNHIHNARCKFGSSTIFLVSFLWAIKTGQYEDDYTPSVRILFEDELINNNQNTSNNGSTKV